MSYKEHEGTLSRKQPSLEYKLNSGHARAPRRTSVILFAIAVIAAASFFHFPIQNAAGAEPDNVENTLFSSVPAEVNLVLSVDATRVMRMPFFKQILEDPENEEMAELRGKLEKYDIELEDFCEKLVFFADTDAAEVKDALAGAVMQTAIDEDTFKKILELESAETDMSLETREVNGFDVYLVGNYTDAKRRMEEDLPGVDTPEQIAFAYLAPDRLLAVGETHIDELIESLTAGETFENHPPDRLSDIDRNALVWGVFEGTAGDEEVEITGGGLTLDITDSDGQGFEFKLALELAEEASAREMFGQTQMLTGMMLPMFFEENPSLGQRVEDAIELGIEGREVLLSVSFDAALLEDLRKFTETQAQEAELEAPPAPHGDADNGDGENDAGPPSLLIP